ncbi:lipoprotein [Alkalibacterium sp. AK22]|uniref:YqgU-like beta propeller domain-containing protein n=1 Tax=Alkalibacterium sp. AK22 TaxID=1229520 RepID=UPI00044C2D77|nr:hypothetical protein [Alkalibacterium sp. AK22]EXJ22454.1 lipoprotein [Alkalibacterium sp. AK22]
MFNELTHNIFSCVSFTCCSLFLFACAASGEQEEKDQQATELTLHKLEINYQDFQKIAGWVSNDTLLVHSGDSQLHAFHLFDIFTGEIELIYESDSYILSTEINQGENLVLFQEVSDDISQLHVMELEGGILHSTELPHGGYVTLDWNTIDPGRIFISHYAYDPGEALESIRVQVWDTEQGSLEDIAVPSMYPKWYSSNVYLYVDELKGQNLYIVDSREADSDMLISRDIRDFFLHQDTFIGIVPSDINENHVYLFHEYPFLVGEQVITIPKVSLFDAPVKPFLTQSRRDGDIYGVIAREPVTLEEELGTFALQKLDFEAEDMTEIMPLPYDAPVLLSPNEEYVLFGWRYEYLIDLGNQEMHELVDLPS